jgi:hypothetical protein
LGKREDNKKRPLTRGVRRWPYKKDLIMEHARRLGGATGKFVGVVISHDMTKGERLQCKQLVAEAKKATRRLPFWGMDLQSVRFTRMDEGNQDKKKDIK